MWHSFLDLVSYKQPSVVKVWKISTLKIIINVIIVCIFMIYERCFPCILFENNSINLSYSLITCKYSHLEKQSDSWKYILQIS